MFHKIIQTKMSCTSVLLDMPAHEYLQMVGDIYRDGQGGIAGQRAALKTKTARTIRERMVTDIQQGVSLPAIVVGVLVPKSDYPEKVNALSERGTFLDFLTQHRGISISIIDGMQRTTALIEALNAEPGAKISDLRIEFWVTSEANSLVYRMLVLNTGQVPWDVARQLEAVYRPLLKRIQAAGYGLEFLSKDDGRRSNLSASEYETEDVVELLLIFSSRKRELNLKDQIAQDFVRLDMIESSSHADFIGYFTRALILLSELNAAVSEFEAPPGSQLTRYSQGKELFRGFPAKAGFMAALAIHLFDRPGFDTDWENVENKFRKIEVEIDRIIGLIKGAASQSAKLEVLRFDDLEERIAKHRVGSSQVGRFEREYFEYAFTALFENIERIRNLQACWSAY